MRFYRWGLCVILLAVTSSCAQKVVLSPATTVPAAQATAKITKDANGNTEIDLRVAHLALPQMLNPPRTVYIVWAQTPGNRTINLGRLLIGKKRRGTFQGVTSLDEFRLLITAEDLSSTDTPSQDVVLSTDVFQVQGRALWR